MKRFALVLFAAGLCACAAHSPKGAAEMSRGSRTVPVGRTFLVELQGNPSEGFRWTLESSPQGRYVRLVGEQFLGEDGSSSGPGKWVWTFRAVGAGAVDLAWIYSKAWGGDPTPLKQHIETVKIR